MKRNSNCWWDRFREKRGYLNSEGRDESIHLEKLYNIVEKQKNPADLLIEEFKDKKDILSLLNNTYYWICYEISFSNGWSQKNKY